MTPIIFGISPPLVGPFRAPAVYANKRELLAKLKFGGFSNVTQLPISKYAGVQPQLKLQTMKFL